MMISFERQTADSYSSGSQTVWLTTGLLIDKIIIADSNRKSLKHAKKHNDSQRGPIPTIRISDLFLRTFIREGNKSALDKVSTVLQATCCSFCSIRDKTKNNCQQKYREMMSSGAKIQCRGNVRAREGRWAISESVCATDNVDMFRLPIHATDMPATCEERIGPMKR